MRYVPSAPVCAVCCAPASSMAVTVTPGTTAPVESLTTPRTLPESAAAAHVGLNAAEPAINSNSTTNSLDMGLFTQSINLV